MSMVGGFSPAGLGGVACIAALLLYSCGSDRNAGDRVVAEAYGEKLYWSDLRPVVPVGTAREDSVAMARRFLENWARDRVMLHKAEENLDQSQLNVEAQLKDYRESLINFAYEQALVEQNLDTVVTDDAVKDYYEKNLANFQLKDNIVRVRWFKLRNDDKKLMQRVEELWRSTDDGDRNKLEVLLAQRGATIVDSRGDWVPFMELQQQVPLHPDNPTDWLQGRGKVTVSENGVTWFVNFIDHQLKDSTSPLELVAPQVRSILINQRKLRLVERLREELYNDAVSKKDVVIP
ncbi:MAG: hypothetical protein ACOH13_05445 [Flavobacteriales bacterium]